MWLTVPFENDVHVLPVGEIHELDRGCHCLPVLESQPVGLVVIHGRLEDPS